MQLPDPLLRVLPELEGLPFPEEPLATCSSCAMSAGGQPVVFTASARCCTYHPSLPNFLAGRALRRRDLGSRLLRERLARGEGASAFGLSAPASWRQRWASRSDRAFGRDEALTCPYWVGERALGCSIHPDRNSVCRTWHCKLAHGARSHAAWGALHALLFDLENDLAKTCVERLGAPEGADPERYAEFYIRCADLLDEPGEELFSSLRSPRLLRMLEAARAQCEERDQPMPDVLEPRVREVIRSVPGKLLLSSWSPFDPVEVPTQIFELLSRLDGQRTWREALADARVAGFPSGEPLVRMLWERGLLGSKTELPDDLRAPSSEPTSG